MPAPGDGLSQRRQGVSGNGVENQVRARASSDLFDPRDQVFIGGHDHMVGPGVKQHLLLCGGTGRRNRDRAKQSRHFDGPKSRTARRGGHQHILTGLHTAKIYECESCFRCRHRRTRVCRATPDTHHRGYVCLSQVRTFLCYSIKENTNGCSGGLADAQARV